MRFLYCFPYVDCPLPDDLATGSAVVAMARAAEAAGFDAVGCYEHPAPSERWRQSGGHDSLDPFVTLAFAAAATDRIRVATYLTPLPYRNPFLLAKTAATLDRLAGGRLTLGVGTGYLRSEFAALGADFDDRNERVEEAITVLRMAWTGEPTTFEGKWFSAREITSLPTPVQEPHPPLWIGGNSGRARRRAAAVGGGWAPTPTTRVLQATTRTAAIANLDELSPLIADLATIAAAEGRSGEVEVIYPVVPPKIDVPMEAHVDIVGRLAELGVSWAVVHGAGSTVDEACEWIGRYGTEVIGGVASAATVAAP